MTLLSVVVWHERLQHNFCNIIFIVLFESEKNAIPSENFNRIIILLQWQNNNSITDGTRSVLHALVYIAIFPFNFALEVRPVNVFFFFATSDI